jgi:hypothetical protein
VIEQLSRQVLSGFGQLRIVCDLTPAVFEPEAVAVHLEDVNVVGKPIEQRAGESLGAEHPVHSSKGKLLVTMIEPRS